MTTSDPKALSRERVARRIARELPENGLVNLGIGCPTLVANYMPKDKTILLHSENGFTGLGGLPAPGQEDPGIVNAGGKPVTMMPGGCFFDTVMSFAIVRGGHVDVTVLGALEVDEEGNIANYAIPGKFVPGMGGAMDLVIGAKKVIISMDHINKNGGPKILKRCTLPLTAEKEADLIVTDMAFIRVTPSGLVLEEVAEGVSVEEVIQATGARLIIPSQIGKF